MIFTEGLGDIRARWKAITLWDGIYDDYEIASERTHNFDLNTDV